MLPESKFRKWSFVLPSWIRWPLNILLFGGVVAVMVLSQAAVTMIPDGGSKPVRAARTIDLAMFQYALDHDENYPTGASSTEVFQQLLDGDYLTDPAVFYVAMPGKIKGASKTLRPENVSWDVTSPVSISSPDEVPVVFLTGYRITYDAGGSAVPLFKSPQGRPDGMAVTYHTNSAVFKADKRPDHVIENFIPAGFTTGRVKWRQLTPEGTLSDAGANP